MTEQRLIDAIKAEEMIRKNEHPYFDQDDAIATLAKVPTVENVIAVPCKVGDMAYFLIEDTIPTHHWYISAEKITEVCSMGFFTSAFYPAENDFGNYIPYSELGNDVFLSKEAAEKAIIRYEGGDAHGTVSEG